MSRIENGPGQTADGAKEEREGVIICPCHAWLGGGLATHAARNAVGRRKIPLHSPVALSLYAITILHCARQRTGEGVFVRVARVTPGSSGETGPRRWQMGDA